MLHHGFTLHTGFEEPQSNYAWTEHHKLNETTVANHYSTILTFCIYNDFNDIWYGNRYSYTGFDEPQTELLYDCDMYDMENRKTNKFGDSSTFFIDCKYSDLGMLK